MKTLLLFFAGIFSIVSIAQDGSLDVSFGDGGIVIADVNNWDDSAYGLAEAPNGRILVLNAGQNLQTGDSFWGILAFTSQGDADTSFSDDGFLELPNPNTDYYSLIGIQQDGKILYTTWVNDDFKITRLLENGTLDADFGTDGEVIVFNGSNAFKKVVFNQDDSFFAISKFNENGTPLLKIKKFLPNGVLDSSYGINGILNFVLEAISTESEAYITNNGKLVVHYQVSNSSQNFIVRYLPDGNRDMSFGTNGIAVIPIEDYWFCRIVPLNDDSILIGASFYNIDDFERKSLKMDPSGNLDQSFANNGYLQNFFVTAVQNNQRIIAENSLIDFEGGVILNYQRFYSNGIADSSFNFEYPYSEIGYVNFMFDSSGKILIASSDIWYHSPTDIVLFRYNNNALGNDSFQRENFKIFPNPSNGIFIIERELFSEKIPFQITDIAGKIIVSGELTEKQSQLNLSSAQSGVYFLKTSNSIFRLLKN